MSADTRADNDAATKKPALRLMITGAPASGKGTQCALIAKQFGIPHISTGDMLRAEVAAESELGTQAKDYMEQGKLVPDELIIDMLLARLEHDDVADANGGWLLDGFPRNDAQAAALESRGITPQLVLHLEVPDEEIISRVTGRRMDPETGEIYNLNSDKPSDESVLERLVQRSDDTEEKVKVRLEMYHSQASKLLDRYQSVVRTIDGTRSKSTVFSDIERAISALSAPKKLGAMILGAPGCGKGTQCELISSKYGLVHISTGDMLRAAVEAKSQLGVEAKAFMERGELVPDELVIAVVEERLSADDVADARGWLLDGFPRTVAQADALAERGIVPDVVLKIDVPQEILVRRVVGRRSDPQTKRIYHLEFDPPTDPEIAARLIQRADDEEHKVRTRLEAYNKYASLLEQRYAEQLAVVNGDQGKLDVLAEIAAVLDRMASKSSKDDDSDGDNDGTSTGVTESTNLGAKSDANVDSAEATQSTKKKASLSVNEFVRRAEEAYESGSLSVADTNWSGQAGAEPARVGAGSSSYGDVFSRPALLAGDLAAFLAFAAIGSAAHHDESSSSSQSLLSLSHSFRVALPFIAGWLAASPLLGAYTSAATSSYRSALLIALRCSAVGVPVGVALRGLATSHVPPAEFAAISFITCTLLLSAWRCGYIAVIGPTTNDAMRRGGVLDGFSMITTLLRRW